MWVCAKHDHHAVECPIGRVSEQEIHAAFARAYRKLKAYADILLHPALKQLSDLNAALQKGNPAMLKVNRAIAETDKRHYKITKLMNSGILDETVGGKKLRELNIQMTALRRERRQTLKNGEIEELIEILRKTAADIMNGPMPQKNLTAKCSPNWWTGLRLTLKASGSGCTVESNCANR